MTDQASFLFGGGIAAAFGKNDPYGTRRGGLVTMEPEIRQQTDFDTDEPLTWKDGSPRMQMVVTVQTDQRDPANPDDDGQRRFYIKGKLQYALAAALKQAGASQVSVGGQLYVTYTGEEPNVKNPRLNDIKLYVAEYIPPNPQADFMQQGQQQGDPWGQAPQAQGGYQQAPPQHWPAQGPQQPVYQQPVQQAPQQYGGVGGGGQVYQQQPPVQQAPPVQQQAPIQPPSQQQAPQQQPPAAGVLPPGFDTSNLPPEALAMLQNMGQAPQQ